MDLSFGYTVKVGLGWREVSQQLGPDPGLGYFLLALL
jgi:hypothetical protein